LSKYAEKLAKAQRARKKKQVTKIYAKIKNVRKDFLHKATTKLAQENKQIFVGDVNALKLVKTKMAKSVLDASWGRFKSMLAYKALKLGIDFRVTNEKYSTVTCSHCLQKTGPSGLSALGVREWECSSCGSQHQRDVNAAKNILIFALGHESPSGEIIY
jgi:IS605 OrfB family transposase